MQNFTVYKFYSYTGPNVYLDRQAMVFNVFLTPDCPPPVFFKDVVCKRFPSLGKDFPDTTIELFARTLSQVFMMDMNLFIRRYTISKDEDEFVVALEHIDDTLAKEAVKLVSRWFVAMSEGDLIFDFEKEYVNLQELFNDTIFGGPTIYSLIEGAIKRKINVHWLEAERQLQWGYGRRQLRGLFTVFHNDSIKDVEFTTFKDRVCEFMDTYGFPSPKSVICFDEEEAVDAAYELGFPLVIKPAVSYEGAGISLSLRSEPEVKAAFMKLLT
jgi:cyanophycin synthetase